MFERDLDAVSVRARLGLGDDFIPWLEELESIGAPTLPARLPDTHEAGNLLARLGVSSEDADAIIDAWLTQDQTPELWWILQRCHQQLIAQMGEPYPSPRCQWLLLPAHLGASGRLFYVYVFLSALPSIRQWHREHGIADDVSWTTLADLGEHLAIHRRIFGTAGLDVPEWIIHHFRGVLYRLGRLHFHRWRLSPDWPIYHNATSTAVAGLRPIPGAPALSLHIPESGGPMTPAICDESFRQARDFFALTFPEVQYRFGQCSSWLLDPQLASYLPPTSNIVQFQQRFQLVPGGTNGDQDVMRFVFRRVAPSLDELPQRTTLERIVVKHLRAGKHWQIRSGWLAL